MRMHIKWACICPCVFVPQCGLLVVWLPLLWIEDQSLSINETREGIWGNSLHLKQIIFQVDRSQGWARVTRVAYSPLPHHPAKAYKKLYLGNYIWNLMYLWWSPDFFSVAILRLTEISRQLLDELTWVHTLSGDIVITVKNSINPPIVYHCLSFAGSPGVHPADTGREAGYNLDRSPVYHRALSKKCICPIFWFIIISCLSVSISQIMFFLKYNQNPHLSLTLTSCIKVTENIYFFNLYSFPNLKQSTFVA